ncbi:hypothetical protein, partial [Nevskia sp.]|uniref:hypothetical protein n=1 Tax=Nevskia sp. TaxID=1929292 RepID=UPI0025CB857F
FWIAVWKARTEQEEVRQRIATHTQRWLNAEATVMMCSVMPCLLCPTPELTRGEAVAWSALLGRTVLAAGNELPL